MKKLMFSALACVAFAFSGFASNEVSNCQTNLDLTLEKEYVVQGTKCYFRVCITDSKGKTICTGWTEIPCTEQEYDYKIEQIKKLEPSTSTGPGTL